MPLKKVGLDLNTLVNMQDLSLCSKEHKVVVVQETHVLFVLLRAPFSRFDGTMSVI